MGVVAKTPPQNAGCVISSGHKTRDRGEMQTPCLASYTRTRTRMTRPRWRGLDSIYQCTPVTPTCRKTPPLEIFSWLANSLAICGFPVDSWIPRPLVEFLGPQSKLVGPKTVTHGRPCSRSARNFGVVHGCGSARDIACKVGRRSGTGGRLEIVLGNCARKSRRRALFLRCLSYCMQGLPPPSEAEGAWNLHRKIWVGGWHARCDTSAGSK